MTILRMTPEAEASGLTAEIYDADRRSLGYVPSHTKAMSLNPEAYPCLGVPHKSHQLILGHPPLRVGDAGRGPGHRIQPLQAGSREKDAQDYQAKSNCVPSPRTSTMRAFRRRRWP